MLKLLPSHYISFYIHIGTKLIKWCFCNKHLDFVMIIFIANLIKWWVWILWMCVIYSETASKGHICRNVWSSERDESLIWWSVSGTIESIDRIKTYKCVSITQTINLYISTCFLDKFSGNYLCFYGKQMDK